MESPLSGGTDRAPIGKRLAAAIIDLIFMPVLLGFLIGFLLLAVPEGVRNLILVVANAAWLVFRDVVFAPGRKMVGLKLVSLSGDKVTVVQAILRNILLIVPFVLLVGYIVEIVMIVLKGQRAADNWAKTQVVAA